MSKAFLKAIDIHKSYGKDRTQVRVLRGASLDVEQGEFLVIRGASGSGKSTLLHILGALDAPDRGSVMFDGRRVFDEPHFAKGTYRNRDIGFVFQFYHLLPELTALENISIARMVGHGFWSWQREKRAARRDATELLERIGLTDRATHRPSELSGGERQRVAIARALMNCPSLLLADEPTGNLDQSIGKGILEILTDLNESGQTIVMVTHDPKVASLAHRQVHLIEGVIRKANHVVGTAPSTLRATKELTP